jgi:hypothetical protein
MIQLIYEKSQKTGEIKRKARWVVRQNGNPETDYFVELVPGVPSAKDDARKTAESYITDTLKLSVPKNRLDRYTLTSEPVKSTVKTITDAVTAAPAKVAETVKSNLQKAGDFLKSTRSVGQPVTTIARSSSVSMKK